MLSKWKPELAYLPVESVVRDRQDGYYAALAEADDSGSATPFADFMLSALLEALLELGKTDLVSDLVSPQIKSLLGALRSANEPLGIADLMGGLRLKHRPTFRKN